MLIPDKATPWLATAVPAGIRIVRREGIDVIMSTSPPSSSHLVAEAIAAATRRPFVADFRDSWLDNPHRSYDKAGVRAKRAIVSRLAVVGGPPLGGAGGRHRHHRPGAGGRCTRAPPHKTTVIENGADFDDFEGIDHVPNGRFTIVHAGSFFGQRSPRPFLRGWPRCWTAGPSCASRVLARFIGELRGDDRAFARGLGIDGAWREEGFLPYRESIRRPARGGRAAAADPPRRRPRRLGAVGQGVRVRGGRTAGAGGGAAAAARPPTCCAASAPARWSTATTSDGISAALERLVDGWADGGLPDVVQPDDGARAAVAGEPRRASWRRCCGGWRDERPHHSTGCCWRPWRC